MFSKLSITYVRPRVEYASQVLQQHLKRQILNREGPEEGKIKMVPEKGR